MLAKHVRRLGRRLSLVAPTALVAAGCATVGPYDAPPIRDHLQRDDAVGECARHLRAIDAKVTERGVRDAMAPRVDGFPYLRIDRFNAWLATRIDTKAAAPAGDRDGLRAAWIGRLSELDRDARIVEFSNGQLNAAEWTALERCRPQLIAADFDRVDAAGADRQRFDALRAAATVPDEYSTRLRALGLYPLTRYAESIGERGWQRDVREKLASPLPALPPSVVRVRYRPVLPGDQSTLAGVPATPLTGPEAESLARGPGVDALGVPRLTRAQAWELLQRHAPVLVVDTATIDDRLGRVAWRPFEGDARVAVDTALPSAYARIAYAKLGERVRVQLVYTFWFPARPPTRGSDPDAGELDGIVWRVTLGTRDTGGPDPLARFVPLAYDTIRPCGCGHMVFPTERVRARTAAGDDAVPFVPQTLRTPRGGERIVLYVAAATHELQRVAVEIDAVPAATDSSTVAPTIRYTLRDDDELRVLTLPRGGTRSIYDRDGLVPGTERLARLYRWATGVRGAGQMRQWGRHPIAAADRRHFDDPLLLDRFFEVVP